MGAAGTIIAVFIGGGLGSLTRFGFSKLLLASPYSLPVATIAANVVSCIVLGLAVGVFKEKLLAQPLVWLFVVVGFCGGFSTFSTFSLETMELIKTGNYIPAVLNVCISIATCLVILFLLIRNN